MFNNYKEYMKSEKSEPDFYPREECTKEESAYPFETPCLLTEFTNQDPSGFLDPSSFKEKIYGSGLESLSEGEILYAVFLCATENVDAGGKSLREFMGIAQATKVLSYVTEVD